MDIEKVIVEIEDALSGNLAKAGIIYKLSLNGLKDKALIDALALLKEQPQIVRCKDCKAWKQYDGCTNLGECEMYPEYNKLGDWFCNFGERKET